MSKTLCPKCGARNPHHHQLCRKCGVSLAPKRPMDKRVKLTLIAILLAYAFYFGIRWAYWLYQ